MTRKQSFRLRFTFWLDLNAPAENDLADYVEDLKAKRSFVKTIRDGLRLMRDLRAGKTDVLCELFPFVAQQLATPPKSNDSSDIKRELDELKELLLRSTTPPMVAMPAGSPRPLMGAGAVNGPKPLGAPKFDLPRFDDDEDTLVISKDTRTDSAQNFLNSMMALQ